MEQAEGGCLCGKVRFTARNLEPHYHACHCGMCRRWSGGPMMSIRAQSLDVERDEALKRYDWSNWAQRAFCGDCGSSLFYVLKSVPMYYISLGAFDDPAPFKLVGEIFVDFQPPGYAFEGALERLTQNEFLAKFGGA